MSDRGFYSGESAHGPGRFRAGWRWLAHASDVGRMLVWDFEPRLTRLNISPTNHPDVEPVLDLDHAVLHIFMVYVTDCL